MLWIGHDLRMAPIEEFGTISRWSTARFSARRTRMSSNGGVSIRSATKLPLVESHLDHRSSGVVSFR